MTWRRGGFEPPLYTPPPYASKLPDLLARARAGDAAAAKNVYDIQKSCASVPADPAGLETATELLMQTHQINWLTGNLSRVEPTKLEEFCDILNTVYKHCLGVERVDRQTRLAWLQRAAEGTNAGVKMEYARAIGEQDPAAAAAMVDEVRASGYVDVLPELRERSLREFEAGTRPDGLIDAFAIHYAYASLYHARYGRDLERIIGRHVQRLLDRADELALRLRPHEIEQGLARAEELLVGDNEGWTLEF
ncbi:MAG: hypothetical protein AAGA68_02370 [Pseudomonadota bacterium]